MKRSSGMKKHFHRKRKTSLLEVAFAETWAWQAENGLLLCIFLILIMFYYFYIETYSNREHQINY